MSNPIYTVEAGRCIMKNGTPFVSITRASASPCEADQFCHTVVSALNRLPLLVEVLEAAVRDGRLQTAEDRERFRRVARKALRQNRFSELERAQEERDQLRSALEAVFRQTCTLGLMPDQNCKEMMANALS